MTVDARDALLARLWILASYPLEPVPIEEHTEEIRTFIEACVRPEDDTVNVDVAQSIIPQKYREEFELAPDPAINDDPVDVVMDEGEQNAVAEDNDLPAATVDPQTMYILPPTIPAQIPQMSLAEMHYNIQAQPMSRLLAMCHKTQTTDAFKESIIEGKLVVTFGRIEELKRAEKWSAKQLERFTPPARQSTRWDNLLSEARFVRAGKTGQRRQKMAMCHLISQAVLEYFEDKKNPSGQNSNGPQKQRTHHQLSITDCGPIVSKRSLDKLSQELVEHVLPDIPTFDLSYGESVTNSQGLVPVSKFITPVEREEGWKRVLVEVAKQSSPDDEDSVSQSELVVEDRTTNHTDDAIRVKFRARSDHEIKPPTPPPVRYLAARVGSAWHPDDGQQLLLLVKQYHNNWALVSTMLNSTTTFTSNVERRTPWQAFERWVQLVQPDPKDFKGRYAEAARQWLNASAKASQAARKRQMPVALANDTYLRGHRRLRWASMLEGIRKVKRKRETVAKPVASNYNVRQRVDVGQHKTYTARELSQVKADSDKKIAAQIAQNRIARARPIPDHPMPAPVPGTAPVTGAAPGPMTSAPPQGLHNLSRVPSASDLSTGMPSIAGLPLPPSVAAAARLQQLKAQQAQQQAQQAQQAQAHQSQQKGVHLPQQPSQQPNQQPSQFMPPLPQQPPQIQAMQSNQAPSLNMAARRLTPQQQRAQQAMQAQKMQQVQTQAEAVRSRAQSGVLSNPQNPPRPRLPFSREQFQNLMAQISQTHPNLSPQEVQQLALQHMRRYVQMRNAQAATKAAQTPQTAATNHQMQPQASETRNASPNPAGFNNNNTNSPAANSPVMQSPVLQSPSMQSPSMQSPAMQSSVMHSPVMHSPAIHSPAMQSPVMHSPAMQSSVMHSPASHSPVINSPVINSPVTHSPVNHSPVTHSPVTRSPATQSPVMQRAVMQSPRMHSPASQSPAQ